MQSHPVRQPGNQTKKFLFFIIIHLIFKGEYAILPLKIKGNINMLSVEDKILARIKSHGRGWAMTNGDFGDLAKTATIDWSLYRLKDKKIIRPLLRGIYDYPRFSELLKEEMAPDMEMVARAIARKFQWNILISGNAALNYLGLSTQVPMRLTYFSDGPTRQYEISSRTIEFKHISLKEARFANIKSEIIVQALRELGAEYITAEIINKIRNFIPASERNKILKDTQFTTDWIHDKIKLICSGEN